MSPVYSLSDFLKMLYPDSNIPSYLYRFSEQNIVHAEPEQSTLTYPPGKYLSRLLAYRLSVDRIRKLLWMHIFRLGPGYTDHLRAGHAHPLF